MEKSWKKIWGAVIASCLCIKYSDVVFRVLKLLFNTLKPLWIGFAIAYILNILMKKLEKIYFPHGQQAWVKRTRRPICAFSSIFLVLLAAAVLTLLVVPALGDSIYVLTKDIPRTFLRFQRWLSRMAAEAGFSQIQEIVSSLEIDWKDLYSKLSGILSKGISGVFTSAVSAAGLIASFTVTGVVAVIFSIYILFQKENLRRQIRKAADVYLPQKWYHTANEFLTLAHQTFTDFISGQVLEACILGTLCGVGMCILRLPYALMTGAIVGVSALIPVIGAYIGAFAGAFMIVTISPFKALVFLVFLVILQQIEGNVIYPRVVGASIGLPGIWVLAAVTVGGGLLGVSGMLIGVPFSATLYKWIRRDVNQRQKKAEQKASLKAEQNKTE